MSRTSDLARNLFDDLVPEKGTIEVSRLQSTSKEGPSMSLTPYDPEFAGQMEVAEHVMREDRDVLRKLAG
jgi:hypothetical protein